MKEENKMNKLFVITMFFLAMVVSVQAQPFLVCDEQPDAESYLVILNDGAEIETPAPLHYDLSSLEPGQYVVTAKAKKGVWVSEPAIPLEFQKPSISQPTLSLSTE